MNKLEKLEEAYKSITRKKKLLGYKYGETDCVSLFCEYDTLCRGDNKLKGMITGYTTPRSFHNKIIGAGYLNFKDLLFNHNYVEVVSHDIGDVCIFNSKFGDFTVAIFDGKFWVNSSDSPKYERLPSRFVLPRSALLCRLELTNA